MEDTLTKMEIIMKDIGKTIFTMAKEFKTTETELAMKETGIMTRKMEKEFFSKRMAQSGNKCG